MAHRTFHAGNLPEPRTTPHIVAVLALPGVVLGDFAIPVELFSRVALPNGVTAYRVKTCGPARTVPSTCCEITMSHGLTALRAADTVIVTGVGDIAAPVSPDIIAAFIVQATGDAHGSLQPLQEWINRNLANRFCVAALARRHATSVRTLHRRFVEQTGMTPAQWILQRRVRHAQVLLETSSLSTDAVAQAVGFSAASTFRERFRAIVGTNPRNYRRLYRPDRSRRRAR